MPYAVLNRARHAWCLNSLRRLLMVVPRLLLGLAFIVLPGDLACIPGIPARAESLATFADAGIFARRHARQLVSTQPPCDTIRSCPGVQPSPCTITLAISRSLLLP